jgi:hypothetical protein
LPGRILGYRGGKSVTWEFDYGLKQGVEVWDLFPGEGEKDVWYWHGDVGGLEFIRTAAPFFGVKSEATLQ